MEEIINELKSQDIFKDIADEQLNAFGTFVQNKLTASLSENTTKVSAETKGSIYKSFAESLGLSIPDDNFSQFESDIKKLGNVSNLLDTNKSLKQELETLKKDGIKSDEALKQLAEKDSLIEKLRQNEIELKAGFSQKETEIHESYFNKTFTSDFDNVFNQFELPSGTSDSIKDMIKQSLINKVKTEYTPRYNANNELEFVVNGEVFTNKNDLHKPHTLQSILALENLTLKSENNQTKGNNTKVTYNQNKVAHFSNIQNAEEAHLRIDEHLKAQGMTPNTDEYRTAKSKIWLENEFNKLKLF